MGRTERGGERERERGGKALRCLLPLAIAIVVLTVPGILRAQTLLRWKLKPGEALAVEIVQHTDSQVAFSGKTAATKIDLTLKLGWQVTAAEDESFTIQQTVERIQQKITTPQAATIEYDSGATGRPSGQARDLAEALKPLVGAEFEMVMNGRGVIDSVKPVNDAAKALLASAEKEAGPDAAPHDALQQMLRRQLVVLPEKKVSAGDTWTISNDRTAATGSLKLDTTYRLDGLTDQDGKRLAKIGLTAKATPGAGAKINIKSHDHSGTIVFSADEGRVVEISQTQKLVTERPYRETTIVVTLNSTQKTTVKPMPAGERSGR